MRHLASKKWGKEVDVIAWLLLIGLVLVLYLTFLWYGVGKSIIGRINNLEREILQRLDLIERTLAEKLEHK